MPAQFVVQSPLVVSEQFAGVSEDQQLFRPQLAGALPGPAARFLGAAAAEHPGAVTGGGGDGGRRAERP